MNKKTFTLDFVYFSAHLGLNYFGAHRYFMKAIFTSICYTLLVTSTLAQGLTATAILEKSIQYHDPAGNWSEFHHTLKFVSQRPNGADRNSIVTFDNTKGYFELEEKDNNMAITMDKCEQIPEGKTCDQVKRTRNYYLYLWGLPMKLKDEGTPLDSQVREEKFKTYDCYVLRVPYEDDIWYFYIDRSNYALRGYMFYKDEPAKKGEVIYLEEESSIGKMKLPQKRSWYTTPDQKFLGTDILLSSN